MSAQTNSPGGRGGHASVEGDGSTAHGGDAGEAGPAPGGRGGDAKVSGNNSIARGGKGGRGGVHNGGQGGDVNLIGDATFMHGGEGGEASQIDGRGGRGGRAYIPPHLSFLRYPHMKPPYGETSKEFGRSGDGPDTPQYKARRLIIEELKARFFRERSDPHSVEDIWYDRTLVGLAWLNGQLEAEGHRWRVSIVAHEYSFTDELKS